ncbi:MAG: uridine kinase [Clostridiales bacterium]|nr:uridine kinase [Clostridiales bacterium]
MNRVIIGIAGGSGSGKTTLAKGIIKAIGDEGILLAHDFYYRKYDELTFEERSQLNYDHPNTLETDLLIKHLYQLKKGKSINRPIYSFVTHLRLDETINIKPKKVIIVEGILLFENKELREMMDIKVFVDTDSDIRLARRIERDVNERGRSLDSVLKQYLETVKPMHDQFVEPSKKHADLIIPEGGYNQVVLNILIDRLRSIMDD